MHSSGGHLCCDMPCYRAADLRFGLGLNGCQSCETLRRSDAQTHSNTVHTRSQPVWRARKRLSLRRSKLRQHPVGSLQNLSLYEMQTAPRNTRSRCLAARLPPPLKCSSISAGVAAGGGARQRPRKPGPAPVEGRHALRALAPGASRLAEGTPRCWHRRGARLANEPPVHNLSCHKICAAS